MLQNSEQNSKQGTDNKVDEIEVENIKSLALFFTFGSRFINAISRGCVDFLDASVYSQRVDDAGEDCEARSQ
jgi:hypothetical protein